MPSRTPGGRHAVVAARTSEEFVLNTDHLVGERSTPVWYIPELDAPEPSKDLES